MISRKFLLNSGPCVAVVWLWLWLWVVGLLLYCLQMYSLDATSSFLVSTRLATAEEHLTRCACVCVCTSLCGRYLTRLEVLSIKNNKIAHINYHFCSLTQLRELSLSHNKLTVRIACICYADR